MPLIHYLRLFARALLLLLFSSLISCFGNHWDDCQSGNRCGGFDFSYPFGKKGSGCGDPNFQIDCPNDDPDQMMITINGEEYHILNPTPSILGNDSKNHIITIINEKLWPGRCSLSGNYTQSFLDGPIFFDIAYDMATFGRDCAPSFLKNDSVQSFSWCGDAWYYSLDPSIDSSMLRFCKTHLEIPITKGDLDLFYNQTLIEEGFEITWTVDKSRDQSCAACLKSNGGCGFSNPAEFVCYCPDGTSHPHKCASNGGRKKAIIIGCSIGGVALTAIALVLFLRFYAKKRKQPPPPSPRSSISKVEKFLMEYAYEMPTRYSHSQLKKITNNFAEKLGEGGFGVVYKGKLRNGVLVAVKLLDRHRHSQTQFMNEVATIGRVHHVNLVRLLGYCFETHTSALVYEYMVNGSLEKFIFAGKDKGQILMWEELYSIALGAARGIAYLHQDCEKRIIHFDIKPHNILLDSEFTPKVADFGLAKLCGKGDDHVSMTAVRGTPGYVAPEVWSRDLGPVTDRSDVYSFGMLLLEIVGGRKNIGVQVSRSSQFYFPEWAFKLLETGELGMKLRGGGMEREEEEKARRLTKVGLWCIQYNYRDRPCMSRVVQMLEGNGDDVTSPPLPFNSSAERENPLVSSVVRSNSSIEIR